MIWGGEVMAPQPWTATRENGLLMALLHALILNLDVLVQY